MIEPTPEGKGEQAEVASAASQPSRRKVVAPNTVSVPAVVSLRRSGAGEARAPAAECQRVVEVILKRC